MSVAVSRRPRFEDPALQQKIMRLRVVDDASNLYFLAREYLCLALVIGIAVIFAEYRSSWGFPRWTNLPVFGLAIVLVGALQHRLAGLGHESSHYTFMKNRFLNDLIPDLFCMFPILTCVHFYRVFHMAHHQYTNDPGRDPDLLNLGHGKRAFEFPVTRARFVATVYFCMVVAPVRFAQFQLAYFTVNTLGKGKSIYNGTEHGGPFATLYLPRLATLLGIAYLMLILWVTRWFVDLGRLDWALAASIAGWMISTALVYGLPDWAVFGSPFRQAYSPRFASAVRLGFFTAVAIILAGIRWATNRETAIYPVLLWLVPLVSTFPFFMLLRDVYQHSNADSGRLTNSRVFYVDRFTRWAVFVYGQDMHIPHHLFPAIPHYRLAELHELLRGSSEEYRTQVMECHGTFHDPLGRTTILDEMTRDKADEVAKSVQPLDTAVAQVAT